jgi:hypothetical protein
MPGLSSFIVLQIRHIDQPIFVPKWAMNNLKDLGKMVLKLSLPS